MLKALQCPNCLGLLEANPADVYTVAGGYIFVGHGVLQCEYCGTKFERDIETVLAAHPTAAPTGITITNVTNSAISFGGGSAVVIRN